VIHGREYGHDSVLDPREVRLGDLGLRIGERCRYEYDFTDYWVHDIRLEAIREAQPGRRYPVLVGGRRSAPPENCGGAWAFLELRQQHQGAPIKLLRMFGELLDADPDQRMDEILGDRYREFLELCRWTLIDRFDRRQPPTPRAGRPGEERAMRITVQVVIENDDERPPERHDVARLDRGDLDAGTVGLQLAEAKQLLTSVQEVMVAEQVRACLDARVPCPDCGRARRHKDARAITLRTAFAVCAWRARGGITAPAGDGSERRSARWRRSCPSGRHRSCSTSSPSSPAWSPMASAHGCWASC
jgi:hypothetical protein